MRDHHQPGRAHKQRHPCARPHQHLAAADGQYSGRQQGVLIAERLVVAEHRVEQGRSPCEQADGECHTPAQPDVHREGMTQVSRGEGQHRREHQASHCHLQEQPADGCRVETSPGRRPYGGEGGMPPTWVLAHGVRQVALIPHGCHEDGVPRVVTVQEPRHAPRRAAEHHHDGGDHHGEARDGQHQCPRAPMSRRWAAQPPQQAATDRDGTHQEREGTGATAQHRPAQRGGPCGARDGRSEHHHRSGADVPTGHGLRIAAERPNCSSGIRHRGHGPSAWRRSRRPHQGARPSWTRAGHCPGGPRAHGTAGGHIEEDLPSPQPDRIGRALAP